MSAHLSFQNSRVGVEDESIDVMQSSTKIPINENQKCLMSSKVDRAAQYSRGNHSDVPRGNVLFPSESDSFYKGNA